MNKHTKLRNTLILQILISAIILGCMTYFVYPFIEKNKDLAGTYYTIMTMISIITGIIIEFFMNCIYERIKEKAAKEVLASDPTDEYKHLMDKLQKENRNKSARNYNDNF